MPLGKCRTFPLQMIFPSLLPLPWCSRGEACRAVEPREGQRCGLTWREAFIRRGIVHRTADSTRSRCTTDTAVEL